jgi:RimJ/RimL family protein N-acetyltransferase
VSCEFWPIFGLRLACGDVELRPLTEDDLDALAARVPPDLEMNPSATTYGDLDPNLERGVIVHQEYWRSFGTWKVDAWRLGFGVWHDGELIGFQELEGNDFPLVRTVDTSSWLIHSVRGQGMGKIMRTAVLALAFGPMDARAAITSAWHDNHSSLGVSRALGYQPNGEQLHARDGGVDRMIHLRLPRGDWLASGHGREVEIEGFEECRPLFGLGPAHGRAR